MSPSRRSFLRTSAAGLMLPSLDPSLGLAAPADTTAVQRNVFGPRPGYSPQIGTFISQLTWMRAAVVGPVRGLTQPQLDWLFDKDANSIGALLLHLAATETYYQMNTLKEVREKSLAEFKKRDDAWFLAVDQTWVWGPTNTLCKWFHVCEHESHHAGQIDMLIKRTPGYKPPA